jgi:uncharacterized protein involved in type VI secretion and phage assembly
MTESFVSTAAKIGTPDDHRLFGVILGEVINNLDKQNKGRVQVRLNGLPGIEPWAQVATLATGANQGVYFMPQVGDVVLVVFHHGDLSEPFVIGSLWTGARQSPAEAASDAVNKRIIRTPKGHKLVFDDAAQSITITGAAKGQISITQDAIELSIGKASLKLEKSGNVSIKTSGTITLEAQTINILAKNDVAISGQQAVRVDGGTNCTINAAQIFIG